MKRSDRSPWSWVPSLYFAEGVPNTIVCTVSIIIFKQLGMSNTDTAFFTSFLAFPWILKPLWTPLLDLCRTKKFWVIAMQAAMGGCFLLAAAAMPLEFATRLLLGIFMLLAVLSATHDAAADGFYILGLDANQQAFFTGVRGTFYRIAMIAAQGIVVLLAGVIQQTTGLEPLEFELKAGTCAAASVPFAVDSPSFRVETNAATVRAASGGPSGVDDFSTRVAGYNASPEAALLAELDAATPEGMALVRLYLHRELADGEKRQISLEVSGKNRDLKLLNGERLVFTRANQLAGLPQLALVAVENNVQGDRPTVFKVNSGNFVFAWLVVLCAVGALYILLAIYHRFAMPSTVETNHAAPSSGNFYAEFTGAFCSFFTKKGIVIALLFILFYRFAESQLLKISVAFVIDPAGKGGLALSNSEYGLIYGTVGVLALVTGGLLGGWALSRQGLRFWMLPMALALNVPDIVYLLLAWVQPVTLSPVIVSVIVEQFGYGFGFSVYMLFMIFFARDSGKYATSHFAIMTGLQAIGLMLPGLPAGYIQETLLNGSYTAFFTWVMAATLVSFAVTIAAIRIVPKDYGRPETHADK